MQSHGKFLTFRSSLKILEMLELMLMVCLCQRGERTFEETFEGAAELDGSILVELMEC